MNESATKMWTVFLLLCLWGAPQISYATVDNSNITWLQQSRISQAPAHLQGQLERIKQQVPEATKKDQLDRLYVDTQHLVNDTDQLIENVKPQQEKLQEQLDILGPSPAPGLAVE